MKNKLLNAVSVLLALLLILPIAACSGFNMDDMSKEANKTNNTNQMTQTGDDNEFKPSVLGEGFITSSYESLSGVSSNYEIALISTIELTTANLSQYVVVSNQLEEDVILSVRCEENQYYLYEDKGFIEGFTYSVALLNDCVDFVDTRFSGKNTMVFTVNKSTHMNVVEKKEIKVIDDFPLMTYQPGYNLKANVIDDYGIVVNDIIKIPVLFYGFKVQRVFAVLAIEEKDGTTFIELREATIEEIYAEIDVSASSNINSNNIYVRYRNEPIQKNIPEDAVQIILQEDKDIIREIENSEYVQKSIARLSAKKNDDIKIKTNFSIKDVVINNVDYVEISAKTKVTIPLVSKDKALPIDFNITLDIKFTIGVPNAVIDPFNKAFGFTVHTMTDTKVTIAFTCKKDIGDIGNLGDIISDNGGLDDFKKYVKDLGENFDVFEEPKEKDLQAKLFDTYVPVAGGVLGIVVESRIAIKIEIQAEAKLEIVNQTSREMGIRKSGGLQFFNNVLEEVNYTNASLEGKITIKAGPVIGLYVSAAGIINAGIELGAGAYIEAAGVFSVQFRENMSPSTALAGYVELGVYIEASVVAEVDLGLWSGKLNLYNFPEAETPILVWGRTKMVTIEPKFESVLIDNQQVAKVPEVNIVVKDLLTHEETVTTVLAVDFNETFDLESISNNISIDNNGNFILKTGSAEEFVEEIKFKLNNYEQYFGDDFNDVPVHIENIPEKYLVSSFTVSKSPIPIEELTLKYEQVLEDPNYQLISVVDTEYHPRNTEDFQIGRLVRVVPEFTPMNASYKTLNYSFIDGIENIQDFRTYEINGVTYAEFRIPNNIELIGDSIKISATSNGYTGEYSQLNVTGSSAKSITITEVPATDFEIGIRENEVFNIVGSTPIFVHPGDLLVIDFMQDYIIPANATTIMPSNHALDRFDNIYIGYGSATVTQNGNYRAVQISNSAIIGEQITVVAEIGELRKEYYLSVVGTSVKAIQLLGGSELVSAGTIQTIQVSLESDGTPTINKASYYVLEGADICNIVEYNNDPSKIDVVISDAAFNGNRIKIVGVIDGVVSEPIEYVVGPISISNILLQSSIGVGSLLNVQRGQEIQHSIVVSPFNATYDTIRYKIVESESTVKNDKHIAELDEYTGLLKVNYLGSYPNQVTVVAEVNGVESNRITYILNKIDVTSISFVPNVTYLYARPGETVQLNAVVNEDASIRTVDYLITSGSEYVTLNNGLLMVDEGFDDGAAHIEILAKSTDNPNVSAEITLIILNEDFQVFVNGKMEDVYVLSSEELVVSAINDTGNYIDLDEISISIYDENWDITNDVWIENDRIVFANDFYFDNGEYKFILECMYEDNFSYIFLNVTMAPSIINLHPVAPETAYAGNEISFTMTAYPSYIAFEESLQIEILSGSAQILDYDSLYINVDAVPNSEIKVRAKWSDDKGHSAYSNVVTLIVRTGIETVEIINVKEVLKLGESYQLNAVYTPSNVANETIKFYFSSNEYESYATLDENTGLLNIKKDEGIHMKVIQVYCIAGGVRSLNYAITLNSYATDILYTLSQSESICSYNKEIDGYLMSRAGSVKFNAMVIDENEYEIPQSNIQWILDDNGQEYFNLTNDGKVTVKDSAPNKSYSAILFASCGEIVGEPIKIVVAKGISNVNDLFDIRNDYYGYYILNNDIDFDYANVQQSMFTPFPMFYGVLDGNGYQIRNILFDTSSSSKNYGLFIENRGIIQNLKISTKISFYGELNKQVEYVGGITAKNYGVIRNCGVNSLGYFFVGMDNSYVGGIAGLNEGLITECGNYVTIFGHTYAGGLVGYNKGTVEYSINARILVLEEVDETRDYLGLVGRNEGIVIDSTHFEKVYEGLKNYNISEYVDEEESTN